MDKSSTRGAGVPANDDEYRSKHSKRVTVKRDVGKPVDSAVPYLSYNEEYLSILNRHHEMLHEAFMFCVFDDDRAQNSTDGVDSVRMMVNCSYVQKFPGGDTEVKHFLKKLREKIYGKSRAGGHAEINLRAGSLDQETYRIKWQKIHHPTDCLVLWYTTELEQSLRYVPTVNVTEFTSLDTDITPVAFPAAYHASDFGNDIYAVKSRFKDHVQLTKAAVSLRAPLDGAGTYDTGFRKGSEFVSQRKAQSAGSEMFDPETIRDNEGRKVNVFDMKNKKLSKARENAHMRTDPESEMGSFSDGIKGAMKMGKDALKSGKDALTGKPGSKQLPSSAQRAGREERMKAYKLALEQSEEYQEDGDELLDTLKQHGWERPPPHGYGSHATDRPEARMILHKNDKALKKVYTLKTGKKFDKDDPESKLWIFDKAKEAAASAASGAAYIGNAGASAAYSVGSAAGRAMSNTGSAVGTMVMGSGPDDEQVIKNLSDRHVKVASNYTLDNTMSNNGLAGLYGAITDKRIKNAFRTISESDEKWYAFCRNIVGKNAWSASNEKCIDGLDGMRETIINADVY
jgi:hypothetical protein